MRPMSAKTPKIVPLKDERRTHLPTNEAAVHLNRTPDTLRGWARSPVPIGKPLVTPLKRGARLLWPVAEIRAVLGV